MTRIEIENEIEKRIIRGIYSPREVLSSERTLADEFGVSKSVIHEVLLSLKEKNFIESRARSGNIVTDWVRNANIDILRSLVISTTDHTTEELARSFGEFRVFNEGKCAALSAQNRTDGDLMEMKECMKAIKGAEDRKSFAHAVARFHHLIFNASGNKLYAVLFGAFMPLVEKWCYLMFPDWESYDPTRLYLVLRAIEKKDAISAEVTMTAYMSESASRLEMVVDEEK